tara:strand:+ start:1424 stop:1651 length:228 start_codon:yes stop_codon:yes gene_type:complete
VNDLVKGCNKTGVRFSPAPQNMKSMIKKLLTFLGFFRKFKPRKRVVNVYSADTNKIDEDGGPYKVEVTDVQQKTR